MKKSLNKDHSGGGSVEDKIKLERNNKQESILFRDWKVISDKRILKSKGIKKYKLLDKKKQSLRRVFFCFKERGEKSMSKKISKVLMMGLMMLVIMVLNQGAVSAGTIPMITEWTIPVDADGVNGTTTTNEAGETITLGPQTTIKLPIPKHNNNSYTVDWGDGSAVETFDSSASFPTHTYENTTETTYTIQVTGTVNQFG